MFARLSVAFLRSVLAALLLLAWPRHAGAAPSQFRFAWLSDTHVGSSTGEDDLRRSVLDINSATGLSFVIISGDVTEYGSREQLRLAREILSGLKIPCHVVAGNHDTKWSESGGTDFGRIFGDDRFVFEFGGLRFIGIHEGPIMKMSDGHWAPQDVRWLDQTLKAMPDKEQPIIFVTHYPIDDGIDNWFVVLDMLKRYNVQAALCGHIHRNSTASFEGVPGVMGRSNLRNTAPVGGYTLVDVADGRMIFSERTPGIETKPPWHSLVLEKHDFIADTNHYKRPDFSVNQRCPQVKELWTVDTGWTIASTPALWKNSLLIGDASGTFRSLSAGSGKEQWQFKTASAIYSTPAVAGNLAVFGCTDGNIYAVDAGSGKPAWQSRTDRPVVASPAIENGTVYIGSSDGKFRALELATGKPVWEFSGLGGFVETRPLLYDGKVIFGAWDQHLYALDAKTGKLVWKWKGDRSGVLLSPAACWPVAAHGKVFIAAPDRFLTAIDARSGANVWRTPDYMVRESIGISADGSRIYARSMQDYIYAFSTSSLKPDKLWQQDGGFVYDINSGMLMEKEGTLFYGTKNGLIDALDARTGAIRWQHKEGVGVVNTLLPLPGDRVVATDFDGHIKLISARH